jgi:hypothetical protein
MILLDQITVYHGSEPRHVELYSGDLTDIPPAEAVDILVASAFPDDYTPTPGSLTEALARKGVSLAELAKAKAVDLRQFCSCWLSQEVRQPGVQFRRILCFEPAIRGRPPEVVGDIFRCLAPLAGGQPPFRQIAMPVVASGDMREDPAVMLGALVDAAVHWLALGLPIERIKIVEYLAHKAERLQATFALLKKQYSRTTPQLEPRKQPKYDFFISYAQRDAKEEADELAAELCRLRPGVRVFLDRLSLNVGRAWQQELDEALADCRKVVALSTPGYLASKVCQEEFNMARLRHRNSGEEILLPIYVRTVDLPLPMQQFQYIDCREADRAKIREACQKLLAKL